MGYLIEGYKIMGKEMGSYMMTHKAGIGTAVSIGGTIVSNILSTKAGMKSARMIDAKEAELGRSLKMGEKLKLCWTNHIGSTFTAGVSCVGAGYSHNQHVKDFNKAAIAYANIKNLYDASKQATREVLGEKKNAELQDKINQKYLEEHPEVKQKIVRTGPNPDPSTMRKFWEPTSGEVIFTTTDKLEMAFTVMNSEMQAMKPRSYQRGKYGIRLTRLFDLLDHELPVGKMTSEIMENYGWNKGQEDNGVEDEKIGAYYTPMLLDPDTAETCAAINWDTKPSDMRMGDYLKL